jgi:hypothetical protein
MEHAFAATPVVSPVKESFFSDSSDSEAEEDDTYYPSMAAKKRAAINTRQHNHDTLKNANSRNVKSKLDVSDENRPHGPEINIDDYPIIVQHPKDKNIWIQVYCPICKGNMRGDGRWFKGTMGAKRHMRLAHKEVCSINTNRVIFGAHEVERLIDRRFTTSELDDLKNGRIPAPVAKPGSSETVDESFQEKDGLDAYIAFDKYPTIVRRADGEWVELRCPTCNGNCIEDKYLIGVAAFRQHLEHGHDEAVPDDEIPAAWVVKRCETRKLTEHELMGLFDDREHAQPPEKVNAGITSVEEHAYDEGNAHAESSQDSNGGIHSHKRYASVIEEDNWDDCTLKRFKQARESPTSSLSIRIVKDFRKDQHDTPAEEDRSSMEIAIDKSTHGDDGVSEWSDCCPCTLEGHECQSHKCSKVRVCMQLDHSEDCRPGATHAFIPLCMMFLLDQLCDAVTCDFSHDERCKKALENHDCYKH